MCFYLMRPTLLILLSVDMIVLTGCFIKFKSTVPLASSTTCAVFIVHAVYWPVFTLTIPNLFNLVKAFAISSSIEILNFPIKIVIFFIQWLARHRVPLNT